jgi:hypothetical protein
MTSAGDLRQQSESSLTATYERLTCVIKTNPGEDFSVMGMISTMFSLGADETLTRPGEGISHRG